MDFIKNSMAEVIEEGKIEADSVEKIDIYNQFEKRINKLDLDKLDAELKEYIKEE